MQPEPRQPEDELDAATPASGDLEVLGEENDFPSLEEPHDSPVLAATISVERSPAEPPAEAAPLSAGAAPLGAPAEQRAVSGAWMWGAIAAGGLGLLVLGTCSGIGVMWMLSPPAPTVASAAPAGTAQPPAPPGPPETAVAPTVVEEPRAPVPIPTPPLTPSVAPASLDVPVAPTATDMPEESPAVASSEPLPPESVPAPEPASEPEPDEPPAESDEPLLASAVPPPPPAIESAAQREEYIAHIRSMLEAGLAKAPSHKKADEHFRKALAIYDSDPRLYFGYALVVRHSDRDEAVACLKRAWAGSDFPYPPAWRLMIDLELVRNPVDSRVIKALPNFAARLETPFEGWPDEAGRVEFATHLGRIVGFWQGPASNAKEAADEIGQCDNAILSTLTARRREAYELGKAEVLSIYDLRQQEASRDADSAQQQNQEQRVREQLELAAKQQSLTDDEQKLARDKEALDNAWEADKGQFLREWDALEEKLAIEINTERQLADRLKATAAQLEALQRLRDLALATQGRNQQGNAGTMANQTAQGAEAKMSGIMLERTFLRTQYDACIVRGQSVILQKQRLVAKYALIEAKYLHDTRQKVGASSLIADKRKVLAGQEERLSKKSQRRSARSAAPADLRRFSAYLPLHVASEQKRIVDSYRDP